MKIVIIGADGQLGSDIVRVLKNEDIVPLTINEIDITDKELTEKSITKHKPDLVINSAAFTQVDLCETEDLQAWKVNALGVKHISLVCKKIDAELLHISTDYIFDGSKKTPYIEDDKPGPLNVYGITKLDGEYYLKNILEKYYICRVSGIYGIHKCIGKGSNFVDTMLKLANERDELRIVGDEILTPTYTLDIAKQIRELIKIHRYGIYHVTNQGECSWYEFACEIFRLAGIDIKVTEITSDEYPTAAKRPSYSVLENKALKDIGIDHMSHWKGALDEYIKEKEGKE